MWLETKKEIPLWNLFFQLALVNSLLKVLDHWFEYYEHLIIVILRRKLMLHKEIQ